MSEPAANTLTLIQKVAKEIRQQLVNGELLPNQKLSEATLSEEFGISRNTLRETFRLLTKEGLLKHEPNRGVFVSTPSIATIIDIYRVRRIIECQALAQAYRMHPAIKGMRQAVEHAYICREKKDWLGVGTANMEFHAAIVELADSERLNALFANIAAELRLAFGMLDDLEFLHSPFVDTNNHLLEMFDSGKIQEAAAFLEDYLIRSERMVLAAYARRIE